MDEAERARKKEILRMIVETLPPETRTEFPDWKINGILDAIEIVEKYAPLIQMIRRAPLPGMSPRMIILEREGEQNERSNRQTREDGKSWQGHECP